MDKNHIKEKKHIADEIVNALQDGKAVDTVLLKVSDMTSITDFMIISSGQTYRQIKALAKRVTEKAFFYGIKPLGIEGETSGDWVLIDLGDVVVHLMRPETREFYNLEKLWLTTSMKQ